MDVLPYGRQTLDEADIAAVVDVLRGDWLTQGPAVERFESMIAEYCGARHAVACNSGTAGLHLAMLAAGLRPGDEFVVPAVTFLATANSGVYVGARPRFADVDFQTVNLTAATLERHLNLRTRAVLPVHFAGLPCDMPAVRKTLRACCPDAVVIEDACHALGGVHADGSRVGSLRWADMVVFSFHPVKHIASGEGGMVLTDDGKLAKRLREFRSHGMTKDAALLTRKDEGPWYYEMFEPGFNYRIPDINCALGASQFQKLPAFLKRRREIAARYQEAFAGMEHVTVPSTGPGESAWHIYLLRVDYEKLGLTRTEMVTKLRGLGVGTQVHYYPVPLQPFYRRRCGYRPGDFPNAERHYQQTLTIPLFPAMKDQDVERVIGAVKEVALNPHGRTSSRAA